VLGGSSFQLGRIFGIRIGVNASWFFILFLFLFWLSSRFGDDLDDPTLGFIAAVIAAVLFFGSIVLHELGHALAARRSGIDVAGIDLFFFGGVMKMSRETDTPGR
jgi:Zn-dependent protease